MFKKLSIFGILSPFFYLLHIIIGSLLWKGYNQITQPISDLTATGAPNRELLSVFTTIYGLCGLIFAICAFIYLRQLKIKTINVSMLLLIAMFLVVFSYGFFPEDIPGTTLTFKGFMHLVVTGFVVPLAILSPLITGLGFRKLNNYKKLSIYSIGTSLIIFVSGGLSVAFMANKVPYFGIMERINIGSLELWLLVLALIIFTTDKEKFTLKGIGKNDLKVV